ncbi:uncharacterized protein EDB93DRAFT_238353 [Suillus bovinus]|uniref:uncharacterized protein n=1 Tax=Suillus bovinus TaxID=48563 RepID=UPI001B868F42|nr:uncharacterized protein EDB93DRAFT_238353 [Suillus bovinus]KAG2153037.1 hypothetical protein EDB93DRAFT_238353 [Suillus bovinus]
MVGVQFDKKDIVRIDKSSALPRFLHALLAKFQMVLWECDGGDLDKDSTGVTRRAWKLLDVICLILEPAKDHYDCGSSSHAMRNLDVCRKIYSRLRSCGRGDSRELSRVLQNALRFTLTAAKVSRDPAHLWYGHYLETDDSRSPEDLDWLMDYLEYIYSGDEETALDILLFLDVMKVRCSPAKQHQFFKSLVFCMDGNRPVHLRHVALRAAHNAREEIASIDAIHDAKLRDMILTELSPTILTAVCPQSGTSFSNDDPDHPFHHGRDLCYLELLFALVRNSKWHPHLFGGHHIDRCISIIAECRFMRHAFYLAGILLRITPGQLSVTSLDSITERQWWDVISGAWSKACLIIMIDNVHFFEFLPVLVEGTKKYMHIAPETYQSFIRNVDDVLEVLEKRYSEQGEGLAVAVKELRTVASEMLEKSVSSKGVISP